VLFEQLAIVLSPDHWPRVARKRNHRQSTEDGVDGPALEAKLAQVSAG
jgi:hypothetical protein